MRTTLRRLLLLALAAAGGVVAWQRRNETPPTPPATLGGEPFMRAGSIPPITPEPPAVDHPYPSAEPPGTESGRDEAGLGGDNLRVITGIGPKLETQLHEAGITTFAQLAALDDAGIDELESRLGGIPGRIRRDDWIGQARQLAEG
jgi:predicted flap endonuclease-1-like 5' DNA nuclease